MKKFVIIMLLKEDWDNPNISVVEALNEELAYEKFLEISEYSDDEIVRGEEEGEISLKIIDTY